MLRVTFDPHKPHTKSLYKNASGACARSTQFSNASAISSINSRVRTQNSEVDNQLAKHCRVMQYLVMVVTKGNHSNHQVRIKQYPVMLVTKGNHSNHQVGAWLPQLPGGYLWLPLVTRYFMTLCCVRGVWLPPLPGGYLWLPLVTSVTRYCMTLCCVCGVWLPPLPGGYLWLLLVTSVTKYCMTLCYLSYLVVYLPLVTFG